MAYYSYRRRYYRRRPKRYVRRYFRRRFRRFVNGSSKSMCRVKIPVQTTIQAVQAANTQGTGVMYYSSFSDSNSWGSPLSSSLYRIYANLYDEVKCIGMKFKLNVSNPIGTSEIPSLQIYSAFDRRCGKGEDAPTFAELKTYSTAAVATAVNNSVAKVVRSIYASDLMEKAQWHDCTVKVDNGVYYDVAYNAAGPNPNFFVPALILAFNVPNAPADQSQTIKATVDITYYYAFRNPKYGAGAANRAEVPVRQVAAMADGDDDLDVEDVIAAHPVGFRGAGDPDTSDINLADEANALESRRRALNAARKKTAARVPVTSTV